MSRIKGQTYLDESVFIITLLVFWTSDQGFVKVFGDMRGDFRASVTVINCIGKEKCEFKEHGEILKSG